MDNETLTRAVEAALMLLNDKDIRIRGDLFDDIANFKAVLNALRSGQLVLASPDRIKEEDSSDKEGDE